MKSKNRIYYKKTFNHLYNLYIPSKDKRYICFYCGLPAPAIDHVPPLSKVKELRMIYDSIIYTKVPSCNECNLIAGDESDTCIFQRRIFVKEKLIIKYKKYIKLCDWEEDEIDQLGYNLRVSVINSMSIKYLIAYRLHYGEDSNIRPKELGYLQYDPGKILKYAKAENWDKSMKVSQDRGT